LTTTRQLVTVTTIDKTDKDYPALAEIDCGDLSAS
jgi:hypothetical protein